MKGTYIKLEVWHLGGRIRQKRGFLPILGATARSLLVSAAGAIGGQVAANDNYQTRAQAS